MYGYEGWYLETPAAQKMGCGFDELKGKLLSNTESKVSVSLTSFAGNECSGNWPQGPTASAEMYNEAGGEALGSMSLSVKEKNSQLPVKFSAAKNKKTYIKITFGSATCQYSFTTLKGHFWGPYPMYRSSNSSDGCRHLPAPSTCSSPRVTRRPSAKHSNWSRTIPAQSWHWPECWSHAAQQRRLSPSSPGSPKPPTLVQLQRRPV